MSEVYVNGKKRDGTKMMVRAYSNFGKLKQVSEHTGVSVKELEQWLEHDKISDESKAILDKSLEQ